MAKKTIAVKKSSAKKSNTKTASKSASSAKKTTTKKTTSAKDKKPIVSKKKAVVAKKTVKASPVTAKKKAIVKKKSVASVSKKKTAPKKATVVKKTKQVAVSLPKKKATKTTTKQSVAKKTEKNKTTSSKVVKNKKAKTKEVTKTPSKVAKVKAKVEKLPITKTVKSSKKEKERVVLVETPAVKPVVVANIIPDKKPRIKNVLISQAYPENGKSPFLDIATKWKLKVDFRSFIQVDGLTAKEFRRLKINIPDYTAIIFNSRNAIDYFFKLCEEMRVKLSQEMKYFCTSEAIALYLQKYIHYRKRKVFYEYANKTLFEILNKHKDNEKFLYPCSKDRKDDIPNFLRQKKFNYAEAYIYQTVPSDLSDLKSIKYDVIIFFSPVGIKSLMHNYPDFIQEDRRIAGFGQVTQDAVRESGFRLDIAAPSPVAPSMAQALENYLKESNGKPA